MRIVSLVNSFYYISFVCLPLLTIMFFATHGSTQYLYSLPMGFFAWIVVAVKTLDFKIWHNLKKENIFLPKQMIFGPKRFHLYYGFYGIACYLYLIYYNLSYSFTKGTLDFIFGIVTYAAITYCIKMYCNYCDELVESTVSKIDNNLTNYDNKSNEKNEDDVDIFK